MCLNNIQIMKFALFKIMDKVAINKFYININSIW